MHRSGTSFTASILYNLGIPLNTSAVIPTDLWNAAGYYENLELVLLNDRIILGDWFGLKKFRQTPLEKRPMWLIAWISLFKLRYIFLNSDAVFRKRANLLQDEINCFAEQNQNSLLKDPRFSLTIKSWREHVGISKVLYSFRHPLEVARSLRKREMIPLWLGLRIWAFHVETFLRQVGDLPVTYVNFNNFFDRSLCLKEVQRCFAFAEQPYNEQSAIKLLQDCLKKDLKKQQIIGDEFLSSRYIQLYKKLQELHD